MPDIRPVNWRREADDSPHEQLDRGVAILAPSLENHGFAYSVESHGSGSGGPFACGIFARGSHTLSLHHRWGLGIVTFAFDGLVVPHADYVAFIEVAEISKLLWTPLSAGMDRYHALSFDLENLCTDFTMGDASMLVGAAQEYSLRMAHLNFQHNAEAVGDTEKRRLARDAFRNKQYDVVIELLDSVIFPELFTDSEARLLDIARTSTNGTRTQD